MFEYARDLNSLQLENPWRNYGIKGGNIVTIWNPSASVSVTKNITPHDKVIMPVAAA